MASAEPTPPPTATVTPPSTKPTPVLSSPSITTPSAVSEAAGTSSTSPSTPSVAAPSDAPPSDADLVHIPSYSRWFSWDDIHECEVRFLPEFFDSRSPSKTPRHYLYLRNSIVKQFRRNPSAKITFTDVRKTLVLDVGSIRRVFDFLDAWGLINYSPPPALAKPLKWEDKDSKSTDSRAMASTSDASPPVKETYKRLCSTCRSPCNIACFTCDKYDITLCARCYVRGHYRVGVSSSDFRRVEISEETRLDWTDKETLQLLEAVTHYGDDWKKVAQYVSGRTEKDCITHFIKLPMGEQLACLADAGKVGNKLSQSKDDNNDGSGVEHSSPSKRLCLTPLADASNPIMAQAAFLSALAGSRVAEAAAQAALAAVSKGEGESKANIRIIHKGIQGDNSISKSSEEGHSDVKPMQKEKLNVDEEFCRVAEVQMKEMIEKIIGFEEMDLQIEKEWKQMEQARNMLFFDQLNYLCPKTSSRRSGEEQPQAGTKVGFT